MANEVCVPLSMQLGELRNMAKGFVDWHYGSMFKAPMSVAMAVHDTRCFDMRSTLAECGIAEGTAVTIIRIEVPQAITDAEDMLAQALASIDAAEKSMNGHETALTELQSARQLLKECTHPIARGAADAAPIAAFISSLYNCGVELLLLLEGPAGGERGGERKGPVSFCSRSTRPSTCEIGCTSTRSLFKLLFERFQ